MSTLDETPMPHDRAPVPIRLRLMHSHGGALDGIWAVPVAGCGLAGALELGGQRLDDTRWRAANLCRIAPKNDGWQLVNGSQTLVCTHNGERILASQSTLLAPGDTLELGLLRFEVELEVASGASGAAMLPLFAVSPLSPIPFSAAAGAPAPASAQAIADAVEFDLRDLAFSAPEAGGATSRAHTDDLFDPFGVLDIAGAQARPIGDPLAELLGDAVARPSPSFGRTSAPRGTMSVDAVPLPAGRVSAVTQRAPDRSTSARGPTAYPAELLFDGLHEEFVRVVQDPTELAGRTDWEGILAADGERAPTLEELTRQAEPYPLLRDILLPREGIDQVIADFDPLGQSTLLDIDESEDVLHLFAPGMARAARAAVPSLTRREHHAMSPDSHMQPGIARFDDKETS